MNTLAMRTSFPKYGTVLLATLLRDRGFHVKVYLEGVSEVLPVVWTRLLGL
jgi:hypothetical protein